MDNEKMILEEQINEIRSFVDGRFSARKPIYVEDDTAEDAEWICPSCLKKYRVQHNYCPNCGQKIAWKYETEQNNTK